MALECFGPFVGVIAADLAVVADVEAVQLVQPVRNRLYGFIQMISIN